MDIETESIETDEQALIFLHKHLKPGQLLALARLYSRAMEFDRAYIKIAFQDRRAEYLSLEEIYR